MSSEATAASVHCRDICLGFIGANLVQLPSCPDLTNRPFTPGSPELVGWTLNRTADIPKSHRFTFGQRLDNLTLDALLLSVRAIYSARAKKRDCLEELNLHLEELRVLWRLVHEQRWINQQQLLFVITQIDGSAEWPVAGSSRSTPELSDRNHAGSGPEHGVHAASTATINGFRIPQRHTTSPVEAG